MKANRNQTMRFDFRKKMIITILPTLIVILVILGVNIYFYSLKEFEIRHRAEAELLANVCAEKVRGQFGIYFEKEKTLNTIISEYKTVNVNIRRPHYIELTRTFLEKNPGITAYWFDFDKDSLDGQDYKYKNINGFNDKGRANVCFQRGTGEIKEEITPDDESVFLSGDYNKLPREAGATIITEPYYYSYTESENDLILMTTIATPIFNTNNKVIGVTGIDVSLDEIVEFINGIKPYKESFATLCSQTGLYLSHPNTQILGKDILQNPWFNKESRDSLREAFAKNEEFNFDYILTTNNEKYIVYSIPIPLGETGSNLWINVHIPFYVVKAGAEALLNWNMLLFVLAILLTAITILIVSKKLSIPLKHINNELIKLANGDLPIKLNIANNDEIGDIAKSTLFVNKIISGLISDTNYLLQEAIKGNFHTRVDVTRHPGDYKKILECSNQIIDVLVKSINGIKKLQSELEESEKKYRFVIENSKDILWTVDLETMCYTFVNDAIYEALGYTKEEFLGKNVRETTTPEAFEDILNITKELLVQSQNGKTTDPKHTMELQLYDKNGNLVWVENSFKITKDADFGTELNKIVGAARIIEDRKKLESEVAVKQKELVKANATKDRFFSIIAHDLKNPISSLLQLSEFLHNDLKNNKISDLEDDIRMLTETLKQTYELLLNLLEWSRSSRGDIVYSPGDVDIANLVKRCAESLKAQSLAKNIELVVQEIPAILVKCDYKMIQTVIRNLVSNAIKFSFEDSKIYLIIEDYKKDNNYIQISIKDAGVGIDEDDIKKLFRIDEKVVSSRGTNDESGTGLGLILCKEFIDKHKCKIWVSSSVKGEGTTFKFILPKINKEQATLQ